MSDAAQSSVRYQRNLLKLMNETNALSPLPTPSGRGDRSYTDQMNSGPLARVYEVFGWKSFPSALFYAAEHALRFDLAGDFQDQPLRFMQAMDRARVVIGETFSNSNLITAIACHYDGEKRTRRGFDALKRLAEIGFHMSFSGPDRLAECDKDHIAAFGEDLYCYWYAANFDKSDELLTALLWAALSSESSITPKAHGLRDIYIVDFVRKIAVHPYDIRGMDIIALDRDTLSPLYERRKDWLLGYDRETMDAKFR